MPKKLFAIASDHGGFELKEIISAYLHELDIEVADLGTHNTDSVDYPDYGKKMAQWLEKNPAGQGVLICGSGIGISIAANRFKHVRAALCHDGLSASLSRQHNDANVLCLGARLLGVETAKDCVKKFVGTEFEGGRHTKRVEMLAEV